MRNVLVSAMVLCSFACGQTTSGQTPAPPAAPGQLKVSVSPESQAAAQPSAPATTEIPAAAAVITIYGFCPDLPAGTNQSSPDCKTVITKAQFEKLIDTLNPKMPPQARQNVANDYSKLLVLSYEARKMGLTDSEHFRDLLAFLKLQVEAQELLRHLQEEAPPSEAETQKYYQEHAQNYEELSLQRLFIPRNNPNAKPDDKKSTDDDLKAEGAKVRARLTAGEDFDKVEKAIYTEKGFTTPPPPTGIPNWRRDAVPPAQRSLFDLKPGELSEVFVEPAGAYVYKVEEKKVIPFETMKPQIESQLAGQKFGQEMQALTASIKPELNRDYFRSLGGETEHELAPAGAAAAKPGPPATSSSGTKPPAAKAATPKK